MTADIIDGKAFAADLRKQVGQQVAILRDTKNIQPGLAVVLVGEDPASEVYVRNKAKCTEEAGMRSLKFVMPEETTEAELLEKIAALNTDPEVNGILVQLPLPKAISEQRVIAAIAPAKDVDGFHAVNAGLLATGQDGLFPCTPVGCMVLIQNRLGTNLAGKHAVVIGRSNIVGRPMAQLLLRANATVTVTHRHTPNVAELTRLADIVVVAVGKPGMVKADWIKPGAVVIDVGINRIDGEGGKARLVGDVDFDAVKAVAGAITPVPGGVGPMTIACLLANTVKATCMQNRIGLPKLENKVAA